MVKYSLKKVYSSFFHRMGMIFSVFAFVTFGLLLDNYLEYFLESTILTSLLFCVFIYCMSRFVGWCINSLVIK
nr:hypothetical protein PNEFENPC_00054 [Escherichia coli]WBW56651.1 hypothetical protein BGAOJDKN_00054 [Escherichia coli]